MSLGRFFSERDIKLINGLNDELLTDIIQTEVTLYRVIADATAINIYGESNPATGKFYYPGISIVAHIDRNEITNNPDDFGPNRSQNSLFKFNEIMLRAIKFYPQNGDIVNYNARYYEVDNVVMEQFLGGIDDKSFSVICHTHYSRLSSKDIIVRHS